ncbi:MAG: AraC family transcriptional regulator [Desulfovibrio sp.]|uniref:AraC family transcriptional regulator n=1 Tax=Desulfovibrio sp. TaxID=885 RepID=UPI00135EF904|nr:AraC family transcriptional regulator [Desulfovibrio sp.]MTJ92947.1 AraC family transcriptional regulator [Desulfovibrio sp.]
MSTMVELLSELATVDGGAVESKYAGVRFFKESRHVRCRPLLYNPGICIVASGYKVGHVGDVSFRYDANNYLVTSVVMPVECESFATESEPLLGLYIDIDIAQPNLMISQMGMRLDDDLAEEETLLAMGPSMLDDDMRDAAVKLLKALRSDRETRILVPGLIKEIYYRALCGSQASMLYSLVRGSSVFTQVAQVLSIMEENFSDKIDVQLLATKANMSISSFHKAFKEITADSPLQYLKKIRLTRAKDLIIQKRMTACLAATEVGYESPSQFSREFKRYFGQSPADLKRGIHTA